MALTKNVKLCLGCLCMGFFVNLTAFAFPFWNYFADNDSQTGSFRLRSIGLWQACLTQGEKRWCQGFTVIKGMLASRFFECVCMLGYVLSMASLFVSYFCQSHRDRILTLSILTICVTEISAVCGVFCWTMGSGPFLQYNLSWCFGLAILGMIFPPVSVLFLISERYIQCTDDHIETDNEAVS